MAHTDVNAVISSIDIVLHGLTEDHSSILQYIILQYIISTLSCKSNTDKHEFKIIGKTAQDVIKRSESEKQHQLLADLNHGLSRDKMIDYNP